MHNLTIVAKAGDETCIHVVSKGEQGTVHIDFDAFDAYVECPVDANMTVNFTPALEAAYRMGFCADMEDEETISLAEDGNGLRAALAPIVPVEDSLYEMLDIDDEDPNRGRAGCLLLARLIDGLEQEKEAWL